MYSLHIANYLHFFHEKICIYKYIELILHKFNLIFITICKRPEKNVLKDGTQVIDWFSSFRHVHKSSKPLQTEKALKYIDYINEVKKLPRWNRDILKNVYNYISRMQKWQCQFRQEHVFTIMEYIEL